jgi:uncharacterized protein YodC (DUF2158 family)
MENKFEFQLGDLVVLKSFPAKPPTFVEEKIEFNFNESDMPIMVVHEIAYNPNMEKLYDCQTSKQIASKNKYHCAWFSRKQSCFSNCWFYEDELVSCTNTNQSKSYKSTEEYIPQIGDLAKYITFDYESNKWIKCEDETKNLKKLCNFISPRLSVKSTVLEKNAETKDQQGRIISKKTSYLVKCVWYNSNANKFSEELLPIESLIIERKSKNE